MTMTKVKAGKIYMLALCVAALAGIRATAAASDSSPANWLYPEGNSQATRHVAAGSGYQIIDSLDVKWSTPFISGDVKPLIGSLTGRSKLFGDYPWAPNDICAVMGDKIVMINGTGNGLKIWPLPSYINGVRGVSALLDTLATKAEPSGTTSLVLGLETMEINNDKDSLAFAYVAGFDAAKDSFAILKRLAIDLRLYKPNIFASIKPVFAKRNGSNTEIYSTINMSVPRVPNPGTTVPPYLRGFTRFDASTLISSFPLPDVGDDLNNRVTLGPEVSFAQPSIISEGDKTLALLPTFPSYTMDAGITNNVTLETYSNRPYLLGFDISASNVAEDIFPRDLSAITNGTRPRIRSYHVDITDPDKNDNRFILVAEEYRGTDTSTGTSCLHLYDKFGDAITFPGDPAVPAFMGGKDHLWSIAVGNIDGNSSNSWLPYYPNNPGNEIVATQSSAEFAFPESRIFVLRYKSGTEVEKPTPPGSYLFPFDTIVTQRVNGWVAAVNDIDGASDGKEEILLVDGGKLMALRLRNYGDVRFRLGMPFDTVFTRAFANQTITSVEVADLEGDGLNDIIVTTNDSTYALGTIPAKTLKIVSPTEIIIPAPQYCAGDTLNITWRNISRSEPCVNIKFLPTRDALPIGNSFILRKNVPNDKDTVVYPLVVGREIIGSEGRFIIEGSRYPDRVFDTTGTVAFDIPKLDVSPIENRIYRVGDMLEIKGTASCVDSVSIQYRPDTTRWTTLSTLSVPKGGQFTLSAAMPCIDIFNCDTADADTLIRIRLISFRSEFADTSAILPLRLLPAVLPVEMEPCKTDCPTKVFTWKADMLPQEIDTIAVYLLKPGESTFNLIKKIPKAVETFAWQIPTDVPETVMIRFCCAGTCLRADTLLSGIKPRYIGIVSPNPFRPPVEQLEIVYRVPVSTTIKISILDQSNRIVAIPVKDADRQKDVTYCDRWDGTLGDGTPAANGMYYVLLELSNGAKEVYPIFVKK